MLAPPLLLILHEAVENTLEMNVVTCKTEHEAELRMNKKEKWDANDGPMQLWNFLDISLWAETLLLT